MMAVVVAVEGAREISENAPRKQEAAYDTNPRVVFPSTVLKIPRPRYAMPSLNGAAGRGENGLRKNIEQRNVEIQFFRDYGFRHPRRRPHLRKESGIC